MAEELDGDPFAKYGGTEVKTPVSGDPFAKFGGSEVKKKAGTSASASGVSTSSGGSKTSQSSQESTEGFRKPNIKPTVKTDLSQYNPRSGSWEEDKPVVNPPKKLVHPRLLTKQEEKQFDRPVKVEDALHGQAVQGPNRKANSWENLGDFVPNAVIGGLEKDAGNAIKFLTSQMRPENKYAWQQIAAGLEGYSKEHQEKAQQYQLPNTIGGQAASTATNLVPDIIELAVTPELEISKVGKIGEVLSKYGGKYAPKIADISVGKFPMQQGAKGLVSGYNEGKEHGMSDYDAMGHALKRGVEDYGKGVLFEGAGKIAEKATEAGSKLLEDAGLKDATGVMASAQKRILNSTAQAAAFSAVPFMTNALEGKPTSLDELRNNAVFGGIMGAFHSTGAKGEPTEADGSAKEVLQRSPLLDLNNFMAADMDAIKFAHGLEVNPTDLQIKSAEHAENAFKEKDPEKKQEQIVQSSVNGKLSSVKAVTQAILKDKDGVIEGINDLPVSDDTKTKLTDKVNEVYKQFDPIEQQKTQLGAKAEENIRKIESIDNTEPTDYVHTLELRQQKANLEEENKQIDKEITDLISKQNEKTRKNNGGQGEESHGPQEGNREQVNEKRLLDQEKEGVLTEPGTENVPTFTKEGETNHAIETGQKPESGEQQHPGATPGENIRENGAEVREGESQQTSNRYSIKPKEEVGGKEVKKTILTKRAYEGEVQDEVKKHLEEKGLTRQSFSQEQRSKQATDFINKFGDDTAVMAVKQGDVDGAMAASILHQLQIKNNRLMSDLDPESKEYEALSKKNADLIELSETKGYLSGEFVGQLAHEYQNAELNYAGIKRQVENATGKTVSKEQDKKIRDLSDQNEKLKNQLDEAEKKLIEETDKAFNLGKEEAKNETKAQKAKRIADKIRQGKLNRPEVFSAATPASIVWDGAVEVVAKSVEAGGKLADAIEDGLKYIRKSNWYKGLSGDKKQEAENAFKNRHDDFQNERDSYIKRLQKSIESLDEQITNGEKEIKTRIDKYANDEEIKELRKQRDEKRKELNELDPRQAEETKKNANIKRLQKELDRLKENREKNTPQKREPSDEEKKLSEQIKQEKNRIDLESLQEQFVNKKGNKFTPSESRDIWKYMKDTYISEGTPYKDAISKVSEDLGLSWRQVSEAIVSPKTQRMSDEMWKKQYDLNRYRFATKNWIETQKYSPAAKALKNLSGIFRGIMVFGHGAIFSGTHAGMTFFSPATFKKSVDAFLNGWRFAYGKAGKYQKAMEELKNSPNYVIARRAGLKNDPDRLDLEEYQKSQEYLDKLGLGKVAHSGERGFNAIKVLRQNLFDYHYDKLSDAEKSDPNVSKSIADIVNLATGATPSKLPSWFQEATFAGGMEVARWQKLTQSPVKAANIAIKALTHPDEATPSEKIFAKVWAQRAGIQLATFSTALIANSILQNKINPKNPVNYTDPNRPDFGKFKIGDISIDPTSGMRGTSQFIYKIGKIPFVDQKTLRGEDRIKMLGKNVASYSKGKLAPFYSDLAEIYSSRDFSGNVVPWSKEKPSKYAHKMTVPEYIWNKMPLPVAEAAAVAYKSAVDNGGDPTTVKNLMKGIMSGAISGTTGFRVSEDENKKKKFSIKSD